MKGTKVTVLNVALSGLMLLSGCGQSLKGFFDPPDRGTVYDKHYSAGYFSTESNSNCDQWSKDGSCRHTTVTYWQKWHEPEWELCIQDFDDPDYKGCRSVSEGEYDRFNRGDSWPVAQ